jgi:hypothetical protein
MPAVNDITFQHPVALVNNLICRDSLEDATSSCAHTLMVCYVVILITTVASTTCFDFIRSSSGIYFHVIAALY